MIFGIAILFLKVLNFYRYYCGYLSYLNWLEIEDWTRQLFWNLHGP
jgi:hypothetical protein